MLKTAKFVVSSMLVSATFGILGYVVIAYPLDSPDNSIRMRGISYLALLPYLLGALINKEGYWQWSKEPGRPKGEKTLRTRTRVLQIIIASLLVGSASVAYLHWGSDAVRTVLLLILTAIWTGAVRRAWLVHKESRRSYQLGRPSR
jgi:hypothetical protein